MIVSAILKFGLMLTVNKIVAFDDTILNDGKIVEIAVSQIYNPVDEVQKYSNAPLGRLVSFMVSHHSHE